MKYKFSISNIGWTAEHDEKVYSLMQKYGFSGLEIAPTRIFPENPYENLEAAHNWAVNLKKNYGFFVPSMQSVWYGKKQRLFGSGDERRELLEYTKKAVDFAEIIGCKNLVFGCPKNRVIPEGADRNIAVDFFKEAGDYASEHGAVIGMEANPVIYNTNYINTTPEAFSLIKAVHSRGFLLNLDVGTMLQNKESVSVLEENVRYIHHVHISEPGLKPVQKHRIHQELNRMLSEKGYQGYISVEMGRTDDLSVLEDAMKYVKEVFGNEQNACSG